MLGEGNGVKMHSNTLQNSSPKSMNFKIPESGMRCSAISTGRAQLYPNTFNDTEHCHGNPTQHIIQSPFTDTNNYDGLTMFQDIKDLNQQREKKN